MTLTISLDAHQINSLNLSPALAVIEPLLQGDRGAVYQQQIQFQIGYPQAPDDPRELSEIPEIRLWFLRLDAVYPWLPVLLDWKAGELARYAAMLVPHQFHPREGILYNPEALELFVMHKLFVITDWLQSQGVESRSKPQSMAQVLGYELDDSLFDLISHSSNH